MARPGITYDQVVEACDQLVTDGKNITIQRVRSALGNTGSPNTIHRHLTAWRSVAPVQPRKPPELPSELQMAIINELDRQTAKALSDLQSTLVEVQDEAKELAKTGERLELDNRELDEANQGLSVEKQRLDSLLQERGETIKHLEKELLTARDAAESARLKLAVAETQFRESEKACERQIGQIESLTTELSTDRATSETQKMEIVRLGAEIEGLLKVNEQQSAQLEKLDDELATVMTEQNLTVHVTATNEAKLEAAAEKIEDQKSQILKLNVLLQDLKKA